MYKVLYQPELQQLVPGAPQDAFAAIVYDGERRLRALIISLAASEEQRQACTEQFELAALLLNSPPSLSVQKERLRSIVSVWRRSEADRRRQATSFTRSANFRADFGRMDIGLNPGWGRD